MNEGIFQAEKMVVVILVKFAIELCVVLVTVSRCIGENARPNLELTLPSCSG